MNFLGVGWKGSVRDVILNQRVTLTDRLDVRTERKRSKRSTC